jgi:hypothetical protein
MKHGFKSQSEERAKEVRAVVRLPAVAPLPARLLASALKVPVLDPNDIPGLDGSARDQLLLNFCKNWSAVTIFVKGGHIIIHNPSHLPPRQESDIMHELAHLLCRHKPTRLDRSAGLPWISRTYDLEQEREAEWLGACLQIPRAALLLFIQRGCDNATIAAHFGASEEMVRFRRNTTGVDTQLSRRATRSRTGFAFSLKRSR